MLRKILHGHFELPIFWSAKQNQEIGSSELPKADWCALIVYFGEIYVDWAVRGVS